MSEVMGTGTGATSAPAGVAPAAISVPETTTTAMSTVAVSHPSNVGNVASMLGRLALVVALIFATAWLARTLQGLRHARGDLLPVTAGVLDGGTAPVVSVKVGSDPFLF